MSCQWLGTSPGHRTDKRMLSATLSHHGDRGCQHCWVLPLPWSHSSPGAACKPGNILGEQWQGGGSLSLERRKNTLLQGCTHGQTALPIHVTALGSPRQLTTHLYLCFAGAVLQPVTCKLFYSKKPHSEFGGSRASALARQGHILPACRHACVHAGESNSFKYGFLPISTLENYLTTINTSVSVVYNRSAVMCQGKEGPENGSAENCFYFKLSALS